MERSPLQQFVGRATRDPEFKTRRDGTIITTSKGGKILGFGLAATRSYDDDADPSDKVEFFDVSVFNEGLQAKILAKDSGIYKGSLLALEGTVEPKGDYNPSIAAMRVGLVTWIKRTVLEESPEPAQESVDF